MCGISVPQPGIKPAPFALEAQNLNHETSREVTHCTLARSHLWESVSQSRPRGNKVIFSIASFIEVFVFLIGSYYHDGYLVIFLLFYLLSILLTFVSSMSPSLEGNYKMKERTNNVAMHCLFLVYSFQISCLI